MEKLKIYKIQNQRHSFSKNMECVPLKHAKRKNINWCNLNHHFKYVIPPKKIKGAFIANISDNRVYHGFVCASSKKEAKNILNRHLSGIQM